MLECIVVGGGAAGLSAALVLGRARRRTLLVDASEQSNRVAERVGGLLGHDRRPAADLYRVGRHELSAYPSVELCDGRVARGQQRDGVIELELENGDMVRAPRVLLATGMQYEPPDLPGLAPLWGKTVFQCPFCHGWEMRDKRLASLAAGAGAVHGSLMLRGWSDDVVVLTDGASHLDEEARRRLEAAKVTIDDRRIVELLGENGQLTAVAFADGNRLERDGLLVEAPLRQRSPLAAELNVARVAGPLAAETIEVDSLHRTSVPGVFAAGDVCAEQPHVAGAGAAGSQAAMTIVQTLLADEFGLPFPPAGM